MTDNDKLLMDYCTSGYIKGIEELLAKGANVNAATKGGFSCLHCAMEWLPHLKNKDFLETARVLVENGASVNAETTEGVTPFFMAAAEGYLDVVKYLHKNGAHVDVKDTGGFNPLYLLIKKIEDSITDVSITIKKEGKKIRITDPDEIRQFPGKHPDDVNESYLLTAMYLIDNGINVDQALVETGHTPLVVASSIGCVEIVKMILEKGVKDINHKVTTGATALHLASRGGYLEITGLLVKAGADPNLRDEYGFTPVHEAVLSKNCDVVKYLVENGGEINVSLTKTFDEEYKKGMTPLDIAYKVETTTIALYLENQYKELAREQHKTRNYEKAIENYKIILNHNPDNHWILGELGDVYFAKAENNAKDEEYHKALQCYKKVIELDPDDDHYWNSTGATCMRLKDYKGAIEYLKKAVEIDPKFIQAWKNLNESYGKLGEKQKALDCYKKILDINPWDTDALNSLGWEYALIGEYEKSLELCKKAVRKDPEYHWALHSIGWVYKNLKKYTYAIKYLEKAVNIKPDDAQYWTDLGFCYKESGNNEKAVYSLKKALGVEPDNEAAIGLLKELNK